MATVVTSRGRDIITSSGVSAAAWPKVLAWGTGNGTQQTAAVSDIGMFSESSESRVTGTSSQVTTTTANDTYQVTGSITATGTRAITEVDVFDSTTKPYSTTWATVPTGTAGTTGTLAASYTPANSTYIQSGTEVMEVTAGTGTTSVTVVRGANGSTAVAQTNGWAVTQGTIPGGTTVTGGSCLLHGDFAVINLNANDSISFTAKIQVQ